MKSKGAKMCHDNVKAESYHQLSGIIFSLLLLLLLELGLGWVKNPTQNRLGSFGHTSTHITQLIVSIAKLEKKFKDIERQNLIQTSLSN